MRPQKTRFTSFSALTIRKSPRIVKNPRVSLSDRSCDHKNNSILLLSIFLKPFLGKPPLCAPPQNQTFQLLPTLAYTN